MEYTEHINEEGVEKTAHHGGDFFQDQVGDDREKDRSARKRLISVDGSVNVNGQPVPNLVGKVAGTVLLLENGPAENSQGTPPAAVTPGKVPIVKWRKQGGAEEGVDSLMYDEAASTQEDRRAQ